jgi:membrane protein implicated in regulation of membrane protease activity
MAPLGFVFVPYNGHRYTYAAQQIVEVAIIVTILETINWRMRRSVLSIFIQFCATFAMALGTLATIAGLGVPVQIAGLALYAHIFYLWFNALRRFRVNRTKVRSYTNDTIRTLCWMATVHILKPGETLGQKGKRLFAKRFLFKSSIR